jgi:curli production assembly/transport component CsgF
MKLLFFLGMLLFSLTGFAQDLVYKPKNPAFGGDTFNYQWMIGSAESQNKFKDKQVERRAY